MKCSCCSLSTQKSKFFKKFGPYLTPADDGPNPDHTETLLEGLKERNVKATFFFWVRSVKNIQRSWRKSMQTDISSAFIPMNMWIFPISRIRRRWSRWTKQTRLFWTDRRTCAVYQTALRLLEMQSRLWDKNDRGAVGRRSARLEDR